MSSQRMTDEEREADRNFQFYDLGDAGIDDILPSQTGKEAMASANPEDWLPGCGCGNCSPIRERDPEPTDA